MLPGVRKAAEMSSTYTGASASLRLVRDALANTKDPNTALHIKHRLDVLERLESSTAAQQEEMERCRTDVVYWLTNYAWTFDPRIAQPFLPFIPWEKQVAFLRWMEGLERDREDGICEKSRDQGATWLSAVFLLHRWLFSPGFKGSIASRKEDLLDRQGDPDSIFEKLRLAIRMLPWWMLPRGFDGRKHLAYLKMINPASGATITGEAGDNIGRGGRASMYVIDEAAFLMRPQKIEAALSLTSDCKVYVSTPNGMGNPFYRKRFSGVFPVFTFHWKEDPRKNKWEMRDLNGTVVNTGQGDGPKEVPDGFTVTYPWYEKMKLKYEHEPVVLAQEVDIDYTASQEGVTIPHKWVRTAVGLRLTPSGIISAALDIADEGGARNVLTIRHGAVVLQVYSWTKGNTTQTAWKAITLCERHGVEKLAYDSGGGYGSGVKAALQSSERPVFISVRGVNAGASPTDEVWDNEKTSKERFTNLKAELWWKMRRRFEKTYEYVEMGINHPLDELISIPDVPDLIQQLSAVQHFETDSGKVQIESKASMKKRGVASPDYADSLVLTEAKVPNFSANAGGVGTPELGHGGGEVSITNSGAVTGGVRRETRRVT
jgi:phage terminase large subunit